MDTKGRYNRSRHSIRTLDGEVVRIGSVLGGNKLLGAEIQGIDDMVGLIRRGLPVAALNYLVAHTGLDCGHAERWRTEPRRGRSRRQQGTRHGCFESDQLVRLARVFVRAEDALASPVPFTTRTSAPRSSPTYSGASSAVPSDEWAYLRHRFSVYTPIDAAGNLAPTRIDRRVDSISVTRDASDCFTPTSRHLYARFRAPDYGPVLEVFGPPCDCATTQAAGVDHLGDSRDDPEHDVFRVR